ncbi:hypothetical protein N0V85_004835 [Neurospora sp. IMI 360204]|nr:hypothetical protein N0V85_004835 [Neurospora sp. IMI 360204]
MRETGCLHREFEDLRRIQNDALNDLKSKNQQIPIIPVRPGGTDTDDNANDRNKRRKTASEETVDNLRQTVNAMSINVQEQIRLMRQEYDDKIRVLDDCFTFISNNPERPMDAENLRTNINAAIAKTREIKGLNTADKLPLTSKDEASRAWTSLSWDGDAAVDGEARYRTKRTRRRERLFATILDGPWKFWEKFRGHRTRTGGTGLGGPAWRLKFELVAFPGEFCDTDLSS